MFKSILFLAFIFPSLLVCQVNRCYTNNYIEYRNSIHPNYKELLNNTYKHIYTNIYNNRSRELSIIRIPVVVHVLYKTENQNLTDSLVRSQIEILNQDYARLNPDTILTRDIFEPFASATGIEFYLAQFDPSGAPTNGIIKKQTDVTSFFSLSNLDVMKSEASGGADAWPTDQYMNIWVCNLSIPILNVPVILGFATPPNGAPNWPDASGAASPEKDGVVIHYEVFGSNLSATGTLESVNRGRTLVHEVGHYLGLRHIWGDPGQGEDGCAVDDGLEDTPNSAAANQQTCDYMVNSCNTGTDDFPDMIENYMDYSDENCLNMFTLQQVAAMRYVVENFRQSLLLSAPITSTFTSKLHVYPNPATNIISISNIGNLSNGDLAIKDLSGRYLQLKKLVNCNSTVQLEIDNLPAGVYVLELKINEGNYFTKFCKF
jgi:hypothetical protein